MRITDRELTLDELLNEPIVRLLMRRDGVEARDIRTLIETMSYHIVADHDSLKCDNIAVEQCPPAGSDLLCVTEGILHWWPAKEGRAD
jgi:hypothetical protein